MTHNMVLNHARRPDLPLDTMRLSWQEKCTIKFWESECWIPWFCGLRKREGKCINFFLLRQKQGQTCFEVFTSHKITLTCFYQDNKLKVESHIYLFLSGNTIEVKVLITVYYLASSCKRHTSVVLSDVKQQIFLLRFCESSLWSKQRTFLCGWEEPYP